MKKYLGYIPAILFFAFYLLAGLFGTGMALSVFWIWLGCFLIAAVLLHKGIFWGGILGTLPALHAIYTGNGTAIVIIIAVYYIIISIYLFRSRD